MSFLRFIIILLLFFSFCALSFSEEIEEIQILTYYPSPFCDYKTLHLNYSAIKRDTTIPTEESKVKLNIASTTLGTNATVQIGKDFVPPKPSEFTTSRTRLYTYLKPIENLISNGIYADSLGNQGKPTYGLYAKLTNENAGNIRNLYGFFSEVNSDSAEEVYSIYGKSNDKGIYAKGSNYGAIVYTYNYWNFGTSSNPKYFGDKDNDYWIDTTLKNYGCVGAIGETNKDRPAIKVSGEDTPQYGIYTYASSTGSNNAYGLKARVSDSSSSNNKAECYALYAESKGGASGISYGVHAEGYTNAVCVDVTGYANYGIYANNGYYGLYAGNSYNSNGVTGRFTVSGGVGLLADYKMVIKSGSPLPIIFFYYPKYGIYASATTYQDNKDSYGIWALSSYEGIYCYGSGRGLYCYSSGTAAGYFWGKKVITTHQKTSGDTMYVSDIAELIPCSSNVGAGDVVVINPGKDREVIKCSKEVDVSVVGVISGSPHFSLGDKEKANKLEPDKNYQYIALKGLVYANVNSDYGEIKSGDLLTTSPTPGHAMKAKPVDEVDGYPVYPQGCIVGKALEPLKSGKGRILILVCLM